MCLLHWLMNLVVVACIFILHSDINIFGKLRQNAHFEIECLLLKNSFWKTVFEIKNKQW